jgi:hypothetical protein
MGFKSDKPRVGFYGCSKGGKARVVRVTADKGREPATAHVDCPVCGTAHLVEPMWRPTVPEDEGRKPDLVLAQAAS